MTATIWSYFAWIVAASLLGFGISAIFAGRFKLSRRLFLIPYVALTALFLYAFLRWSGLNPRALLADNWLAGMVAGILVGAFLVINVRSQPQSRQTTGQEFVLDLTWLGLVYGAIDALFLNIMPVLAMWQALSAAAWPTSWVTNIAGGLLALAASLFVTLTYHLGYPEFRNRSVGLVLLGNALITLAFLLSANPLGALVSHTLMHLAAVIQGPETTVQLPPHLASR